MKITRYNNMEYYTMDWKKGKLSLEKHYMQFKPLD